MKRAPTRRSAVNSEATSTMFAVSLTASMLRCEILTPYILRRTARMAQESIFIRVSKDRDAGTVVGCRHGDETGHGGANGNGKGYVEYAELPPGVGFAAKDEPLRRDINLLRACANRPKPYS